MNNKRKNRATIRVVAGAYLGVIAYRLLFGNEKEALLEYPILIGAGIFFMAMAILIVLQALKELKQIRLEEETAETADAVEAEVTEEKLHEQE